MEWLIAIAIGTMTATGVYLLMQKYSFSVMLGLAIIGNAVNLYIFSMGRLVIDKPPIVKAGAVNPNNYTDPVPQALVLTAIVIGFGMLAYMIVLSLRSFFELKSSRVDGLLVGDEIVSSEELLPEEITGAKAIQSIPPVIITEPDEIMQDTGDYPDKNEGAKQEYPYLEGEEIIRK